MKENILRLRAEGKSYREIEAELGCSKGTLNYHLSKNGKAQTQRRRRRFAKDMVTRLKMMFGGKCQKCGYNRCLEALDFHHRDPATKDRTYTSNHGGGITSMIRNCSFERAVEEAKKCDLICANCHREEHAT